MVSIGCRPGRQSALASAAVAQPEHDGSYDEQGSSWDPNDQRPGKTGADVAGNDVLIYLGICKKKTKKKNLVNLEALVAVTLP